MQPQAYFSNKLVFITGGSSGIGLAIALQCAGLGAHVAIAARRMDQIQTATAEIEAARVNPSQKVIPLQLDVTNSTDVLEKAQGFIQQHGTPDILVNCAGITLPGHFEDLPISTFHEQMDVNFFGTLHVTKAFIRPMIDRRSGHIINISSAAGFIGTYGYTAYGATKFAVRGFSDTLRAEMRRHNINVSVVLPGDVDTPQLAGEMPHKPAVTRGLSATSKVVSADYVAKVTLRDAARKRYIILPGSEVNFLFTLSNLLGRFSYWFMDRVIDLVSRHED